MPTNLTGDFDVVAEFAIPAVNRILAAMHAIERFPHSLALRVDDNPPHGLPNDRPVITGVMDMGDATSNHHRIPRLPASFFTNGASGSGRAIDSIVNIDLSDLNLESLVPSRLQGRAQVQVSPPTIDVTDPSGNTVTIRLDLICRYIPDPEASPAAEFIRGQLQITAPVDQTASQLANVITIDVKANSAQIAFTPQWSSTPLSAEDLASINRLMRNAFKTGFLPANIALPASIAHAQFKALQAGSSAVAVMLDLEGLPGNRATLTELFVAAGDDFAFGVGADFVRSALQPTLDNILQTPVQDIKFKVNGYIHTWTVTYHITLNSAALDLENGKMVLVIKGHASTSSWTPSFDFTVRQDLTLIPSGATADLEIGNISLSTSSWIVNLFRGPALDALRRARDRALQNSDARGKVMTMLDADAHLGGFLRSLLTPARRKRIPFLKPYGLAYTSVEIHPTGVILHGTLAVASWAQPRVEYEQIPSTRDTGPGPHADAGAIARGPDYSALKSWIPGGSIDSYEWKSFGQATPGHVESNRFVYLHDPFAPPSAAISSILGSHFSPLCVTVRGTRLSASGPVTSESVTATACGFNNFPIPGVEAGSAVDTPLLALTRSGPDGTVEVVGHALPESGRAAPNLIVHFAGDSGAAHIDTIKRALAEHDGRGAATAILVVTPPGQLSMMRYTEGVSFAEDSDDRWKHAYNVTSSRQPVTLIVNPNGKVSWKHEGELDSRVLSETLRKHLKESGPFDLAMPFGKLRIGQPAPNFIFEIAGGKQLTLDKIGGRKVVLVFCSSASAPSLDALRDAERNADTTVLAINDGADVRTQRALQVHDPKGKIAAAYAVTMWPTTVELDDDGIVRAIHYGRDSHFDNSTAQTQRSAK